jgi:hypothetical protein
MRGSCDAFRRPTKSGQRADAEHQWCEVGSLPSAGSRSHLAAISPRIIRELRLGRLSIAQRRSVLMRVDGPPEAGFHGCLVPRTSAAFIRRVCRASLMAAEVQVRRRDNPTCHAGDWVLTHSPTAAKPKLEGRIALEGSSQRGTPGLKGPRVLSAALLTEPRNL